MISFDMDGSSSTRNISPPDVSVIYIIWQIYPNQLSKFQFQPTSRAGWVLFVSRGAAKNFPGVCIDEESLL